MTPTNHPTLEGTQPPLGAAPRVLIADDMPANVRLLQSILRRAGYSDIAATTDSESVIGLFASYNPDILLLDLHMPGIDGLSLIREIRLLTAGQPYLPIVVLTGDTSSEARRATLAAGASDFVAKPYDSTEVLLRVRNLLETRRLHLALDRENRSLEQRVRERTNALLAARFEVLERLAIATEMRDDDTGEHTRRVGLLAGRIADEVGESHERVELIARVAPLHDIGKIAIPDHILKKPGNLTAEEYAVMKTHTTVGASILAGGDHAVIVTAERIAHTHHERWDGGGYPNGLRETQIPLEGRIVAVADFFDALSHERIYRPALARNTVLGMISAGAGTQFDPQVAGAFIGLAERGALDDLSADAAA